MTIVITFDDTPSTLTPRQQQIAEEEGRQRRALSTEVAQLTRHAGCLLSQAPCDDPACPAA